jgi:MoaA/NifB/PqqE/SkfB family radical SAM enzyme
VVLQGIGEPTLHPRIGELIGLVRADRRFGLISFNTNALLREPEDYAALEAAGLGHVSISVDTSIPRRPKRRGQAPIARGSGP